MSRGTSFISVIRAFDRAGRAAMREADRCERRMLVDARRAELHERRVNTAKARDAKARFHETNRMEAEERTQAVSKRVEAIESLLLTGLSARTSFSFDLMLRPPPFCVRPEDFIPPPISLGERMFSWVPLVKRNREKALSDAEARHRDVVRKSESERAEVNQFNEAIEAAKISFVQGEPNGVALFFEKALAADVYPAWAPGEFECAYSTDSRLLTVNFLLPTFNASIPQEKSYKYVKTSGEIVTVSQSQCVRKNLYGTLVAQMTLRVLHRTFDEDREGRLEAVAINAFVETDDLGTGNRVKPCLVSVRVTRERFESLNLRKVNAAACLKQLNASVSVAPAELAAVKPVVLFNMTDSRFIAEVDVLSGLDYRKNLMELSPQEFESLIANLFKAMGLETRQTQLSGDGGVDCVAFDARPIFGGKVVIQAKRYKNTVGVSAVRDLFGTMQNEGASKGILVTTSGYGSASINFASGKPIELLDGGHLLHLLKEHAGIDAKIVMPE